MYKIKKRLAGRIREIRVRKGLSQEELAHKAGLHLTHIGMIERGKANPTLDTLNKISSALKVPLWEIFMGLVEEHRKPGIQELQEKKLVRLERSKSRI